MPRLGPGDRFPALRFAQGGRGSITLPDDLAGSFGVVLFYRGSWCPYCRAQLRQFQSSYDRLAHVGAKIVAASVDDGPTTQKLVDELRLWFPVGHSVDAHEVAAATGAFVNPDPVHLQSTGFVLDPEGRVIVSVYSSGAIGRLTAEDTAGLIHHVRDRQN